MAKPKDTTVLVAKCKRHSRYAPEKPPKNNCASCWLLHIMFWQHVKRGEDVLGSLNPYAYKMPDVPLEEACFGIQVQRTATAQS